jgi:uncharacterized OB-fold protein
VSEAAAALTPASGIPLPVVTELSRPYWDGLAEGELRFQRCAACGNAWLPAREECPACLADAWAWEASGGGGRVISWVIYRQGVHPAFADRVPYNVAVVELDEGPRLITSIDAPEDALAIEQPVRLVPWSEQGVHLARFAPVS